MWLPAIVEKFNAELPSVTVNIQTGTVAELYGGLMEGKFDICFGSKIQKYDLKWTPLATDRFLAILPKDYPTDADEFPISGFNGTKFLMPGLGFDDDISAVFAENGVKPFVTPTYVDDPAIISMVEHSLGISMLSELILSNLRSTVKCVPIVPAVYRELVIATRLDAPSSPAVKRLIAITKEFVRGF
jgi:DNA-binding transcriptional LysR family regulator